MNDPAARDLGGGAQGIQGADRALHSPIPPFVRNPVRDSPAGEPSIRDQVAVLWALAAGAAAGLATLAPAWIAALPACRFKALLGLPCPGCGAGRATLLLAAGRPLEALGTYPLPTLAGAVFLGGGLVAGLTVLAGHPLPRPTLGARGRRHLRFALILLLALGWAHGVLTGI